MVHQKIYTNGVCTRRRTRTTTKRMKKKEDEGSNCNQSFFFITDCWNASFLIFACQASLHSFSFFSVGTTITIGWWWCFFNHPRQSRPSQSVSLVILMNCGQQTKRKIKKIKNQKSKKRKKMLTAVFGPIEVGKIEFQKHWLKQIHTKSGKRCFCQLIDWFWSIIPKESERDKTKGLSKMKSVFGVCVGGYRK